jgi:hypothetical protein
MTTEPTAARAQLRAWVADNARGIDPAELSDATALFEQRLLTSLQFPELILLIERLSGHLIDVTALAPGDFRDIDTIMERFVDDGAAA